MVIRGGGGVALAALTVSPQPTAQATVGQLISFSITAGHPTCTDGSETSPTEVPNTRSYSWAFGDGESSTDPSPSHTYKVARTEPYIVTVTETVTCRPFNTYGGYDFPKPDDGQTKVQVTNPTTACTWAVDLTPVSIEENVKPGTPFTKSITLLVDDGCGTGYEVGANTAKSPASKAEVTAGKTIINYTYDVPSDATNLDDKITITLTCPTTPAAVPLYATPCDRSIEIPVKLTVEAPTSKPTATISPESCDGAPGQYTFTGTATGGTSPYSYQWSLDGSPSSSDTATYDVTFSEGEHTVTFTVTDSKGQTGDDSVTCRIKADASALTVTANLTFPQPYYETGKAISFNSTVTGGTSPYTYAWTYSLNGGAPQPFGGNVEDPSLTPNVEGQYAVNLTVTDSTTPTPQQKPSNPIPFTVRKAAPSSADLQKGQSPDSAGTNQKVDFSVTVLTNGQPTAGIPVTWTLSPNNASGQLDPLTTTSGPNGVARTQLTTGNQLLVYSVTATVQTQSQPVSQTFKIAVGIAPLVNGETTPEKAMAIYTDRACQSNQGQNRQLTNLCNQLGKATPDQVNSVMNQLTPRNAPDAANANQTMARGQGSNIQSRLAALRHGASGVSVSGLTFRDGNQTLSAEALAKALRGAKGGAAGDEPGVDLGGRLGLFINGTIDRGDKKKTTQEEGFDYSLYNITGGVDYRFTDAFLAGLALGYTSSSSDLDNSGGDMDATGYSLAAYANYSINENVFLDGVLMYGWGNFDMKRNIDYVITGQQFIANASPDSDQWGARVGGGYEFNFGQGTQATVGSHLNYLKANLNSYNENGAEDAILNLNLHVDETTLESFTFGLSGELSHAFSMSWGMLTPRLRAEWIHEFKDGAVPISGWYLSDPLGGVSPSNIFSYPSDTQDPNYFLLGVGASAVFSNGAQGFLFYQATVGKENYTDNLITGGIRFEF